MIALLIATFALAALCAGRAGAQQAAPRRSGGTVALSLDDALKMAQAQSHTIEVARAGVTRASGQRSLARSQMMPQLNASAAYGRTLASQFSSFSATATPVDTAPQPIASQSLCTPFIPANATTEQRNAALAQAATCQASSGGGSFDLSKTSFGAKNQYQLALAFTQSLYTGGKLSAQSDAADAQLRSANIEVNAQRAQVSLDVTSAYYDAVLADQFLAIADSSLAQTEVVLSQTKLARQVGNSSEYDLLRAQVTRDNQIPVRLQAIQARQVAYLRLKQLLTMPLDDSLTLTTGIEGANGPTLPGIVAEGQSDTSSSNRAPVRELDEAIRASEAQVKIAHADRLPAFSLTSNYQRLYFPVGFPQLNSGVNNWTLGLSASLPILDGGRIRANETIAQAGVAQAKAQRDQAKEFAALDTRVAITALREAEAAWEASRGTADQAQRAYAIDEVRYREGISTQTDLSSSRLLLEQAKANRAQAARNLAVARVRLALIKDLPIQAGSGASSAQGGQTQSQQQQQQQQSQQRSASVTQPATGGTP
jgi:outer membrane protein TolC